MKNQSRNKALTAVMLWSLISVTSSFLMSCGNENAERPETITKLRALGVEQTPINARPGDTVSLTFYLAALPNLNISSAVELDTTNRFGVPIIVTPQDASPMETTSGPISLYKFRTTYTVPASDPSIAASIAKQGYARARYKVRFSAGSEYEAVVGDTVIYPTDAPQLAWKAPEIAISKPATSVASGVTDIEGTITSEGVEPYRVSWFVSDGKVKNRRAKVTSWSDAAKGNQTIIMTVRGTKSGAFAIKSQTVTIN